jgi:hypothetical protein
MKRHMVSAELPVWYELGWQEGTRPAILLRIEERTLEREFEPLERLMREEAERMKTALKFDLARRTGFGEMFIERTGSEGGFAEFRFPIPDLRGKAGPCFACNGTGRNSIMERTCELCRGRKRHRSCDWGKGRRATRTLGSFLELLRFPEKETKSARPQLLTLQVYAIDGQDMHGFPLGGEMGIPLVRWLASYPERMRLDVCAAAMEAAYERMLGKQRHAAYRAWSEPDGRFHMDVPGNCACLGSMDFHAAKDGSGASFSSHNVDGPWQQLALAAGVAALHDLARKEMK